MPFQSQLRRSFLALIVLAFTSLASAATIDRMLTVQVYRLCDNAGSNCAALGPSGNNYFAAETNKIWSQAGITVDFNFVSNINSSAFSAINDAVPGDGFVDLVTSYGSMGPSSSVVDMFLVRTVAGAYGEGWLGAGGLVIAMDTVMAYNGGLGRIDTIAHELGHNLGLDHTTPGNNYLMTSGATRTVPTTIANITPDGLGLSLLSPAMITNVRDSTLLTPVPEPFSLTLAAVGLLVIGLARRRNA